MLVTTYFTNARFIVLTKLCTSMKLKSSNWQNDTANLKFYPTVKSILRASVSCEVTSVRLTRCQSEKYTVKKWDVITHIKTNSAIQQIPPNTDCIDLLPSSVSCEFSLKKSKEWR